MDKQTLSFEAYARPVGLVEAMRFAVTLGSPAAHRVVLAILIIFIGICFFASMAIALIASSSASDYIFVLLFFAGIPLVFLSLIGFAILKNARRALRLKAFAEANGFTFSPNRTATAYSGVIFSIGHSPQYMTVVNGTYQDLPFEFGNFYCTVGSGKNSRRRGFGVIEVMLKRKLPHILLDSRANNQLGLSNLQQFSGSQHLTLEGNFNDYFNLYVPNGYERDALYFITPELMAILVDMGAKFDIEIIDDRLYIYQNGDFELQEQPIVEKIFQLIAVLGGEVQENTSRYADANIGNRQANIVAEPGRRLKRTVSWISIVFFIIWLGFIIATSFL